MTTSDTRVSEIIAEPYHELHRAVRRHLYTHYDLSGGRGSLKSSTVSIEVVLLILRNPKCHALVMRKVANTLRTSVYSQYLWAISKLGLDKYFTAHTSPMELIYKPTEQRIIFFGADDAGKLKSIKLPFGYIGVTHFEEKDQFSGRAEIRTILQSTMRGGELFWNFESYNPPISASNWANEDSLENRPDRLCHKSTYLDVPREWLGEQFFTEAEILKEQNPRAYEHEYLGVPTGTGGNVFENVVVRDISNEEISQFDRIYNGVDWGWYPDPFAFDRMHFDAARRTLYIFDEYHCNKKGNAETAKILTEEHSITPQDMITADSAEPKSVGDYRSYGLFCRAAEKGAGSVEYSMKWLQSLCGIVIDGKRCPETAKEFLRYEYEHSKDGEIISGYPDKDNHHIDAVRYGMSPVWRKRGR